MDEQKKRLPWPARWALGLAAGALTLVVLLATINAVWTALETASAPPAPGRLVEVAGTRIHLVTSGQGTTNLVLLPGLGTISPALDFQAVAQALGPRFRVTIVEYPGYGRSGDTDRPRTTQAETEEVRQALKAAGLEPPYLLVPHSFSGLLALDWSLRHREELVGVLGLDPSVPAQGPLMGTSREAFNTFEVVRTLGLARWILLVNPSVSGVPEGLSAADRAEYLRLTNTIAGSHGPFLEMAAFRSNCLALVGQTYPADLPVTLLLASSSVDSRGPGQDGGFWLQAHQDQARDRPLVKVEVLKGGHYIHHGNEAAVAASADRFLEVELEP